MFTIKYVYPTGQEHISGPYEMITSECVDGAGVHQDPTPADPAHAAPVPKMYRVVYAYTAIALGDHPIQPGNFDGASMTFGPNVPYEGPVTERPQPPHAHGLVYVMNEHGATVAKYKL